MIHFGF